MLLVKRELESWNETFSLEAVPHDPIAFSYWVVSSLPLDDSMKITLLAVNSAIQRLRDELDLMRAVRYFYRMLRVHSADLNPNIVKTQNNQKCHHAFST